MTAIHIQPAPGRDPYAARRVAVYKNLHKGAWSICALDGPHKGKVVGHAAAVSLTDCAMHVGAAARHRIANGAPREVHAWVVGTLAPVELRCPQRISYRPTSAASSSSPTPVHRSGPRARSSSPTPPISKPPNHTSRGPASPPPHGGWPGPFFLPARRAAPAARWPPGGGQIHSPSPLLLSAGCARVSGRGPDGQPTPAPGNTGRETFSARMEVNPQGASAGD